jgi:hypothetical protein
MMAQAIRQNSCTFRQNSGIVETDGRESPGAAPPSPGRSVAIHLAPGAHPSEAPRRGPLRAHPRRFRCMALRPKPDVRSGSGLRLLETFSNSETPRAPEDCDAVPTLASFTAGHGVALKAARPEHHACLPHLSMGPLSVQDPPWSATLLAGGPSGDVTFQARLTAEKIRVARFTI